jgi:hypothetical protein
MSTSIEKIISLYAKTTRNDIANNKQSATKLQGEVGNEAGMLDAGCWSRVVGFEC